MVVAGGGAAVQQLGRTDVFAGVDEGAGQGVLDDLSLHPYAADPFRPLAEAVEQVRRHPWAR